MIFPHTSDVAIKICLQNVSLTGERREAILRLPCYCFNTNLSIVGHFTILHSLKSIRQIILQSKADILCEIGPVSGQANSLILPLSV